MLTRKREGKAILANPAKDTHDRFLRAKIHTASAHRDAGPDNTLHILLRHTLSPVMGQGMRHFVPHNRRKTILILGDRNNTRINRRISTR